VRDGKAESRVTRRANALLLLDDGWRCERVAGALYMDDDTIRYWHELYQEKGLTWLADGQHRKHDCALDGHRDHGSAQAVDPCVFR
ncbi:MAG: helix-turn-helix domain-containing protein, partial [Methylocella sp.]